MSNRDWKLWVTSGLAALALAVAPVSAGSPALLTPSGDLLVIEAVGARPGHAPVALRSTWQHPSGRIDVSLVPGTEDAEFDTDPSLLLDPIDRRPLLVWSRHNGSDYDVVVARHDGERWSDPQALTMSPADEIRPRAYAAPGEGFHLVWEVPARPHDEVRYALFRSDTLVPVRGPEVVPFADRSVTRGRTTDSKSGSGSFLEGGGDSPGLGKGDGGGTVDLPPPPADDSDVTCNDGGLCRTGGGSNLKESAVTGCDEFSLVVAEHGRVCWMTRDAKGWSTRACYDGSQVSLVKRGLDLGSSSICTP